MVAWTVVGSLDGGSVYCGVGSGSVDGSGISGSGVGSSVDGGTVVAYRRRWCRTGGRASRILIHSDESAYWGIP